MTLPHQDTIKFGTVDFDNSPDTFKVDGVNCFCVTYENKFSDLYRGYQSIEIDLQKCLECLKIITELQNKSKNLDTWVYTMALLVTYGKCFANSRGRKARLNKDNIPQEYIHSHKKLLSLRNKYVAHADGEGEFGANLIALYPNTNKQEALVVAPPFVAKLSGINLKLRDDLEKIIENLFIHINEKKSIFYKKIVDSVKSQDLSKIYKKFEKFNTDPDFYPDIKPGTYTMSYKIKPNGMCQFTAVSKK